MADRNDEERERLIEERDLLKEEKSRAAEQKRLEAENAARKAAARHAVVSAASNVFSAVKTAANKTGNMADAAKEHGRKAFRWGKQAEKKVYAGLSWFFKKLWIVLTSFAEKRWSVPVFIVVVLLAYVGITYLCGYKLFRLQATPPTFQFYVCDYSVGFCSRLFVGAVIALFADKVTVALMSLIINIAVSVSLVLQAVMAGLLLRTALKNRSLPAAVIGFLFMTNPLAVVENMSAPGLLDVYLLMLFFVWLAFLKTPLCAVVTPVVCVVGMAIHYEFLFSFLPPMLTLLFYYAFFAEKKRVRVGRWLAFAGGSAVSAGSFCYLVFLAKDHLKMTSDEFYQHMLSRFSLTAAEREAYTFLMGAPIFRNYFDYYIFGQYQGHDYFENIGDFFTFLKNWTSAGFNATMLRKDMILFLPVLLLTAVIWIACARREKGFRKLPYICFIGQALVLVPELIISTDIWRWVSAALLAQFFVFAVVYLDKNAPFHRLADGTKLKPFAGGLAFVAAAVYCVYCLTIV
ncbi:MAG: hypothetical protein IJK89_07500 [Clostridia bacterium]|nr:hypothetical protein [Clostridia bacterium]